MTGASTNVPSAADRVTKTLRSQIVMVKCYSVAFWDILEVQPQFNYETKSTFKFWNSSQNEERTASKAHANNRQH